MVMALGVLTVNANQERCSQFPDIEYQIDMQKSIESDVTVVNPVMQEADRYLVIDDNINTSLPSLILRDHYSVEIIDDADNHFDLVADQAVTPHLNRVSNRQQRILIGGNSKFINPSHSTLIAQRVRHRHSKDS